MFLEICDLIFKVVPVSKKKNDSVINIDETAGILLLKELKNIILPQYNQLIDECSSILIKMKKLRNKVEHELHNIDNNFILSGNNSYRGFCFFNYIYKDKNISISTDELIRVINKLNKCFSDIQRELANYKRDINLNKNLYYNKLINEQFCEIIIN